jgi:hypothetical protein
LNAFRCQEFEDVARRAPGLLYRDCVRILIPAVEVPLLFRLMTADKPSIENRWSGKWMILPVRHFSSGLLQNMLEIVS